MKKFGKRTWRYLAAIWLGAAVLEGIVLWLAIRTYDSWLLLLAAALLVIPIAVTVRTYDWLARAPRKRWKRHDLEDELARAARVPAAEPARVPGGRAAEVRVSRPGEGG
jgi:hypothetical protein